jgi:hypothetical protein
VWSSIPACAILCTRIARSIHEFMIYFSHFPAPTTALRFSCKYPTPASDPAHPAFAIPSPEHLPRCSHPAHHGLRPLQPQRYSFSRWSLRHRLLHSNRSSFRFRCGSALHTQDHGNRPDTAAAGAHRRGTDGIIFSSRRCFLFFIHSGVRLNLSQVSIPNEWYFSRSLLSAL